VVASGFLKDIEGEGLPLILSVKRGVWRKDDSEDSMESSDKEFQDIRKSILIRNNNTCQACGFKSGKFQEVHHKDDDHSNNDKDNLVTVCPFCHKTYHLGFCGLGGFGTLIHMPELSQAALNNIVRIVSISASGEDKKWREISNEIYDNLRMRANDMDTAFEGYFKGFPNPPSDPSTIASILSSISDEEYEKRDSWLKDFKILHDPTRYKSQVEHWCNEMNRSMPVRSWDRVFNSIKGRMSRIGSFTGS